MTASTYREIGLRRHPHRIVDGQPERIRLCSGFSCNAIGDRLPSVARLSVDSRNRRPEADLTREGSRGRVGAKRLGERGAVRAVPPNRRQHRVTRGGLEDVDDLVEPGVRHRDVVGSTTLRDRLLHLRLECRESAGDVRLRCLTISTPASLKAVIPVSAVGGSSFVSFIDAVKCIPALPSARYAFTSSIPISIAAWLATPSDDQLPVSENSPPITISCLAGATGSSLQPTIASVNANKAESAAPRRRRTPSDVIVPRGRD